MVYETVIGLEIHAELKTKTKIFCSCSTEFGKKPNENTCPICLGIPGTLPVLNEDVIKLAVKAGTALGCKINNYNKMDRKNYFYPDLTKNFQTSQYDIPMCGEGLVKFDFEGREVKVRINRIHIEEDAGKLNHNEFSGGSLVDLNRAGVPLIEIVSEPDMRSAKEAEAYMRKIKSILEYIEVSDCKMEEGSFRADINTSIRPIGSEKLGTRTEMKNMSSFRSIARALEYEIGRQVEVIDNGGAVDQETLRWDEVSGKTFSMRDKENAQDYRYFPEPDLVAIKLSEEYIENIRKTLPEMPESRKERYLKDYKLSEKDARILTSSKYLSDLFEKASEICGNYKAVNNWIISDISRILNETEMDPKEIPFDAKQLANLVTLIDNGTISSSIGKKVLVELFENPRNPEDIIKEKGWIQISDEGSIKEVVLKIIEANPQSVMDYKAGKDRALGFLVGQAMKETKGKANPKILNKIFLEELKK